MSRALAMIVIFFPLITSAGCLDGNVTISLNPDGSGKAKFDLLITPIAPLYGKSRGFNKILHEFDLLDLRERRFMRGNNEPRFHDAPDVDPDIDPREIVKHTIKDMIPYVRGVDAWSDLNCENNGGDRVRFTGVAYFKKFDNLKLKWGPFSPIWGKDDQGHTILSMSSGSNSPAVGSPQLSDEQIDATVARVRDEWRRDGTVIGAIFEGLRLKLLFLLPGQVNETNVFTHAPGGVELSFRGIEIMSRYDKLADDEQQLKALIKSGKAPLQGHPDNDTINRLLTGHKEGARAQVIGDLMPVFDYAAESDAARKTQAEAFKKLGMTPP